WDPLGPSHPPGARPSREEMKALLIGQTLSRWYDAPVREEKRPTVTVQEIEALEIKDTRGQGGDGGTWQSDVEFIAKAKDGRYLVRGYLSHRLIEGKRAFVGFEIRTVTKQ